MTNRAKRERALKIGRTIYLGGAVLVGGFNVLALTFPSHAAVARCADQGGWSPRFISSIVVKPIITGLTWPVSVFLPPVETDGC
jgi:hypothetical protein